MHQLTTRFTTDAAISGGKRTGSENTTGRAALAHRMVGLGLAGALLLGLAGCASTGSTNPSNTFDNTSSGSAGNDGAGATLGAGSAEANEAAAKKFVACLVDKGLDAKVGTSDPDIDGKTANDLVLLRQLDQAGNPISDETGGVDYNSQGLSLYPKAMSFKADDQGYWVAFQLSGDLTGSPYAGKQADYEACEGQVSEFQQPIGGGGIPVAGSEADQKAVLAFAKQARAQGFSWVQDPTSQDPTTIVIPSTVSEAELREFAKLIPKDLNLQTRFEGNFTYDPMSVLADAAPF